MKSIILLGIIACVQVCAHAQQLSVLPTCSDQELAITGDNELELYVDGLRVKNLTHYNDWTVADKAKVGALAKVVAVRGKDVGVVGGILASAVNFQTDASSWKCTNKRYAGWKNVDFDDSNWPSATAYGQNGVAPWGQISGISPSAFWIWTSKNVFGPASDKIIYCRAKVPACDRCAIIGTGPTCIKSCAGLADGDYQSCKGCNVYVTCSNGITHDDRPCAPADPLLLWDDQEKRCEYDSATCTTCVNP